MFRMVPAPLAIILAFAVVWTRGAAPAGALPRDGAIIVGATFPLTGEMDYYAQSAYYGVITRVRQINNSGGVNGKRLSIIWRDNRGSVEQASRDIEELVEKHQAIAILGPLLSDNMMAMKETTGRLKVPLISPLASLDPALADSPWLFTVSVDKSFQAAAMINFQIGKYGAKTCAILYDQNHTSQTDTARIFRDLFIANGGTVKFFGPLRGPGGSLDSAAALAGMIESGPPDFIFAACYAAEAAALIHDSRELGVETHFCGLDEWDNELLFIGAGTRLAGTSLCSSLYEESFRYRPFQTFISEIRASGMDVPDAQAACSYDAVSYLAAGLAESRYESPVELMQALSGIRSLSLATGRTVINEDHKVSKPVLIRVVERMGDKMVPIYADRYEP